MKESQTWRAISRSIGIEPSWVGNNWGFRKWVPTETPSDGVAGFWVSCTWVWSARHYRWGRSFVWRQSHGYRFLREFEWWLIGSESGDWFVQKKRERERERERENMEQENGKVLEDLGGFDFRDREIGHRGFDSNG